MDTEFRACGLCTQTCLKEHGAHDAAPSPHFTRPPCFLLTSLELSSNWTPIPKEFLDAHGESLRGTARLLGANGKEWSVEIGGPAKFLGFKGGWKSFIASSNIKRGDQMLFSLVSKNCFFVYVFNKLGVEVVAPAVAPLPKSTPSAIGKRKRPEVKAEPVSDDDEDSGSESSDESEYEGSGSDDEPSSDSEPEAKPEGDGESVAKKRVKRKFTGSSVEVKNKKKKVALTSKTRDGTPIEPGSMTTTYESRRRKVTQAELDRTLETAQALKLENPSCTIVMKPSHVYRGFWLNIPKLFAREFLPRYKTEIILQDIHGFEWPKTVWIQNDHHTGLSGGWAGFSKDHCLEEGDVCIYEILDSKDVRILVHIFRVVDLNLAPGTRGGWEKSYNIVYGAGMNRQQGSITRRRNIVKRKPEKKRKNTTSLSEDEDVDDVPLSKLYKEKQLDGNSDITSDEDVKPKILSMKPIPKVKQEPGVVKVKQEPGTVKVKQEPGTVKVKQEPGTVKVKLEPGLKQTEHGEDVKPTLAQLQASLKCKPTQSTGSSLTGDKTWYPVVKMLGRRQSPKSPDQQDFLVALGGCVTPPSQSSSVCEDGNFNWWVPRTQFSPDLATCYFD